MEINPHTTTRTNRRGRLNWRSQSSFGVGVKRVAIIGAGGEMGAWFAKFFAGEGVEVFASDNNKKRLLRLKKETRIYPVKLPSALFNRVNLAKNNKEVVKSADFILVSVLLNDFEKVIREISPELKDNQIVIDIASLKEKPVEIMHRFLKKNLILGTHPLFGPGAKNTKQNFFLTPTNGREKTFAKEFGGWLRKRGFNVIETTPQKHDRLMSVILGIPHFIGLTAGSALAKLNVEKLKEFASPSFKKLLDLVQNVASSSPEFYSELHFELPKINEIENLFAKEVKLWRGIIKSKKGKKFVEKMRKIKNSIGV